MPRRTMRGRGPGAPIGNQNARTHGFYSRALSRAGREVLEAAQETEGLDSEIALLRVKLHQLVQNDQKGDNLTLLLAGLRTLAHLTAVRYRISRQGEDDLYESMVGVLKGIGGVIAPDLFPEVEP